MLAWPSSQQRTPCSSVVSSRATHRLPLTPPFAQPSTTSAAVGVVVSQLVPLQTNFLSSPHPVRHPESYSTFDNWYRYDEAYSALLGAQMHRRAFERSAYGPWERALGGVLFPSPFDEWTWAGFPSAHTNGSSHSMDHFIAYVKGAQEPDANAQAVAE